MYFKFPEEYHTIDAHNHIWGTDQTRMDQLLAAADALGIEKLCISVPIKDRVVEVEKFRNANDAIIQAMQYSDRFLGFCFVDAAAGDEAVAEIDRCIIEHKMRGIKLYHQRKAQDPVQAPVMQRAAELGVPVLLHAGRFLDPDAMNREPYSSDAGDFLEALERYPETIFMQGHIGGGGDWEWNLRMLEKLSSDNYYIDLSGSVIDHTIIRRTVDTVGAGRVLFATDGWFEEAIGKLQAARLSRKEEKMICSENFEKLIQRRKGAAKNV